MLAKLRWAAGSCAHGCEQGDLRHWQGCFVPPGITNYDEYSLVREILEEKKEEQTGTLRKDKTLLRDEKKMERLKQKLHTDDERM